jgi:hypothetical protein
MPSKTGEYQGGARGEPEGAAGSECLAAPDLGFGPERVLGKTDLFGARIQVPVACGTSKVPCGTAEPR